VTGRWSGETASVRVAARQRHRPECDHVQYGNYGRPVLVFPSEYGHHLDWLRGRLSILHVVGQGAWETHPTGALPSTVRLARLLQEKGIRCELDLWGYDVSHDWEWWQRQLAHHLPRFC
jgi:esterase/lipase superfamily enzyme